MFYRSADVSELAAGRYMIYLGRAGRPDTRISGGTTRDTFCGGFVHNWPYRVGFSPLAIYGYIWVPLSRTHDRFRDLFNFYKLSASPSCPPSSACCCVLFFVPSFEDGTQPPVEEAVGA